MKKDCPPVMARKVGVEYPGAVYHFLNRGERPGLLDGDAAHLQPRNSLIANLVHSAKGSDVTHTMVDGAWLMRDRQLLTFDEAEVVAEARRRGERLYARSR